MPAKRSKLSPAKRAKRAAKRARRAAAPSRPTQPPPESLPATLERLGVRAPIDVLGARDVSGEVTREGVETESNGCCPNC